MAGLVWAMDFSAVRAVLEHPADPYLQRTRKRSGGLPRPSKDFPGLQFAKTCGCSGAGRVWELMARYKSVLMNTVPQINMEAHRGPYIEDSLIIRSPSPLPS